MVEDNSFFEGDRAIKKRLEELATESGLWGETIDRIAGPYSRSDHEYFVYGLRGTTKSVTLRASEIRLAAAPSSSPNESSRV